MDFFKPDGHDERKDAARDLARRHVAPSVVARDHTGRWETHLFLQMGAAGLLGAVFPPEYGGGGLTPLEWSAQQEGFGAGAEDAGLGLAWGDHTLRCGVPIWRLGTEAQRYRYLPALCRGEQVGALADGTTGSVSSPHAVRACAQTGGAAWVLEGKVPLVVNAPVAAVFIVVAVTDPERGADGVSAFLVEARTPGLTVGEPVSTLGLRTALRSDLVLERCEVPAQNLLGGEGGGLTRVLRLVRQWERGASLAPWIGLMQSLFERSLAHAKEGQKLGRATSSYQSVRAVLADMKIRLELSRRVQARASWQLGAEDRACERDAAAAHLFLAESAQWVAREAFRLPGASGRRADPFLERAYRDASLLDENDVGNGILRSVIAGSLLQLG